VFDRRRLPWIALVQQEGATSTALLAAPVPLLALTGWAMANNIHTLAVGTVQDLEHHDATRSRWGCSAAETFIKNSTSTPVRHLLLVDEYQEPFVCHLRHAAFGATAALAVAPLAFPGLGWQREASRGRSKGWQHPRTLVVRQSGRGQKLSRSVLSGRIGEHERSIHYPR
jgi:hypothetical protein